MVCDTCKHTVNTIYNSGPGKWACRDCSFVKTNTQLFHVKDTVFYKWYPKGNVSKSRVEMVRSRAICPDDQRSVVMRNHAGKITDRKAAII